MNVDFADTNIFVYLFDETVGAKYMRAREVIQQGMDNHTLYVSYQVVQETLNVITHKAKLAAPPEEAADFVERFFSRLQIVPSGLNLYLRALALKGNYGFSFYDSLIIAAALEAGCTRLLTEDLQHGQRIESLLIENPFLAAAQ